MIYNLTIDLQKAYTFQVVLDGKTCVLSYKGFHGGKSAVGNLDVEEFRQILNRAEVGCQGGSNGEIQLLFQMVGAENAIRIISAAFPSDFQALWLSAATERRAKYGECSLRKVLEDVSGTKATLAHCTDPLVADLRCICETVNSAPAEKTEGKCAAREGITVCETRREHNQTYYTINGVVIKLCMRSRKANPEDVLDAVLMIREAIDNKTDIKPFAIEYGGQFVMRILSMIDEGRLRQYFETLADQITSERVQLFPRKVLKGLGFSNIQDKELSVCYDCILSILEEKTASCGDALVAGNNAEIQKDSGDWILFQLTGHTLSRTNIAFGKVVSEDFAQEIRRFLREKWENRISISQLYRYFNHLQNAANIAVKYHMSSIMDFAVEDALQIKADLLNEFRKPNRFPMQRVAECFGVLKQYYEWKYFLEKHSFPNKNPFAEPLFRNARNLSRPVVPANKKDLLLVSNQSNLLPDDVAMAHQLLVYTAARANDVMNLHVSNFDFKKKTLRFVTSKNHREMNFTLDDIIAKRVQDYIQSTQEMREQYGDDFLLLYIPPGRRQGSKRFPEILSTERYTAQINAVAEKNGALDRITPRGIRAECGREEFCAKKSAMDRARLLGNSPAVSNRHYTNAVSREQLVELAWLLNANYNERFMGVLQSETIEEAQTDSQKQTQVMGGYCGAGQCQLANICTECPLAYQRRAIEI